MNKLIITFFFLLTTFVLYAQEHFQGRVTYQIKFTEFKKNHPSSGLQFLETNVYPLEISSKLFFSGHESLFKSNDILVKDNISENSLRTFKSFTKTGGIYYFDSASKYELHQKNAFGSNFIISHKRDPIAWKISNETKLIGKFTCFKATAKVKVRGAVRQGAKKDVIAWFVPEIPVSLGPAEYYGLPGLILEVIVPSEASTYAITATKVELNPKDAIKIEKPQKGEIVSLKEFENIGKSLFKNGKFILD